MCRPGGGEGLDPRDWTQRPREDSRNEVAARSPLKQQLRWGTREQETGEMGSQAFPSLSLEVGGSYALWARGGHNRMGGAEGGNGRGVGECCPSSVCCLEERKSTSESAWTEGNKEEWTDLERHGAPGGAREEPPRERSRGPW